MLSTSAVTGLIGSDICFREKQRSHLLWVRKHGDVRKLDTRDLPIRNRRWDHNICEEIRQCISHNFKGLERKLMKSP